MLTNKQRAKCMSERM